MKKFNDLEQICYELNSKANDELFFMGDPAEVDQKANEFVESFAKENELKSHTVTPSRWWFESSERMFDEGEIELHPLVNHAIEKLHPEDKAKKIEFIVVNVKDAKLTNAD